jgi:hypothetical protein
MTLYIHFLHHLQPLSKNNKLSPLTGYWVKLTQDTNKTITIE